MQRRAYFTISFHPTTPPKTGYEQTKHTKPDNLRLTVKYRNIRDAYLVTKQVFSVLIKGAYLPHLDMQLSFTETKRHPIKWTRIQLTDNIDKTDTRTYHTKRHFPCGKWDVHLHKIRIEHTVKDVYKLPKNRMQSALRPIYASSGHEVCEVSQLFDVLNAQRDDYRLIIEHITHGLSRNQIRGYTTYTLFYRCKRLPQIQMAMLVDDKD